MHMEMESMLVLTRGRDEQVIMGSGLVSVTVVDVVAGRARLGIEAPRSLAVHRREIYDAIVKDGGRDPHAQYMGQLLGVGSLDLAGTPNEHILTVRLPSRDAVDRACRDGFVRFGELSGVSG